MPSHAVICYYDPNRLPLGRLPLPGITGSRQASLPVTRRDGAEEDLPISEHNPLTVPSPLRRRVPRCPLPVPGTFHGLRRSNSGSAPSWPACGEVCMTTLIRPRNFAPATDRPVVSPRFAPGLSTTHGGVPTGDPDVSPDPTFPGWLPQFARSSHVIWMSPSALGARADGHTLQLHPPPPPGADGSRPAAADDRTSPASSAPSRTATTRSRHAPRPPAHRHVPPPSGHPDQRTDHPPGATTRTQPPPTARQPATPRCWSRRQGLPRPRRSDPGDHPLPAQTRHTGLPRRALRGRQKHPHPGSAGSSAPPGRAWPHDPAFNRPVPHTSRRDRLPHPRTRSPNEQTNTLILCKH